MNPLVDLAALRVGSYFYACVEPDDGLWCKVEQRQGEELTAQVINGGYRAVFDAKTGDMKRIVGHDFANDGSPPLRIAFTGAVPPQVRGHGYNAAIAYCCAAVRAAHGAVNDNSSIPDEWRGVIGTLAHNRQFTAPEITEYTRHDRRLSGPAVVRVLRKQGLIEPVSRGSYYPTTAGWQWIEGPARDTSPHADLPEGPAPSP